MAWYMCDRRKYTYKHHCVLCQNIRQIYSQKYWLHVDNQVPRNQKINYTVVGETSKPISDDMCTDSDFLETCQVHAYMVMTGESERMSKQEQRLWQSSYEWIIKIFTNSFLVSSKWNQMSCFWLYFCRGWQIININAR